MNQHFSDNAKDSFHKAIKQFGKKSFSVDILEINNAGTVEEGYEKEKYWIKLLNSNNPEIGYNRTIGGKGTIGYVFTEEDKRKISVANMGRKVSEKHKETLRNIWKGKHLPQEVRDKISKARIGKYCGEDNSFFGRHHTEETKEKLRKNKEKPVIGISNSTNKSIRFKSLHKASEYILSIRGEGKLSTIISHIANSIKQINCKTAYGYKWCYEEKSNDYPDRE